MPFSLADCILNHQNLEHPPNPLSPSSSGAPKEKPKVITPRKQAGATRGKKRGERAENAPPAVQPLSLVDLIPLSSPPLPPSSLPQPSDSSPSKTPVSLDEIQRLKLLFGEVSSEWPKLVKAVRELKEALAPGEPEAAVFRDKSFPLEKSGGRKAPPPPVVEGPPRVSLPSTAPPAPAPPKEKASAGVDPNGPSSKESSEIHSKLAELLKLLKESLEARGSSAARMVEIPKNLTLEIAREVAGKVKETICSSVKMASRNEPSIASESHGASQPSFGEPVAQKRIPLDDVAAIIDQITGMR